MADIFISYKTEDRLRAEQFATALRSNKWDVWWDQVILPGQDWEEEIVRQLSAARCIVVLWSQACARSRWVEDETMNGLGGDVLVPVLLDDAPLPWIYRRIQTISLKEWRGDPSDPSFGRFVGGIRLKLAGNRRGPGFWIRLWRACIFLRRVLAALNVLLDWIASTIRGKGRPWLRVALTILGVIIATIGGTMIVDSWADRAAGPAYVGEVTPEHTAKLAKARRIRRAEPFVALTALAVGMVLTYKVGKRPVPNY